MRHVTSKLFAVPLFLALLTIAACNGSTVVTLTATPSSDPFITYRVGVASIQLQTSSGKPSTMILPAETTVDFTKVTDLSELLGAPRSSLRSVTFVKSTVVSAGRIIVLGLPLEVWSCIDATPTRYVIKGSDEGVAVSVTTVLPLHAAIVSRARNSGTANSLEVTCRMRAIVVRFRLCEKRK